MTEDVKLPNVPEAGSITGAKILGVAADGSTKLFSISSIKGDYKGVATPATNPGVPLLSEYWLAKPGFTYPNFGNITIPLKVGEDYVINPHLSFNAGAWTAFFTTATLPQASNKIAQWVDGAYPTGNQVYYNGQIYNANSAIVAGEVPGISAKWVNVLDVLKAVISAGGKFTIEDSNGKISFAILENGETAIGKLHAKTLQRIVDQMPLKVSLLEGGDYLIQDAGGNIAFKIYANGEVAIGKFNRATEERIKVIAGNVPIVLRDKIYQKKVSILGDSISTDNGGGNAGLVYPQQYWGRLQSSQQCQIFRSAIGGTTIATSPTSNPFSTPARWQSVNSVFEPDVILIFGGINDFLQDVAIGLPTDTTVATFYGALDYLYRSLLTRCPNARLFHMTPVHTTHTSAGGLIPEFNGQNFLSDYIDAILKVARRYGVGVIDTNRNSGITCFNIEILAADKIHFKATGHEMIYNTIIRETNFSL